MWYGTEIIVRDGKRAELVPAIATEALHLETGGMRGGG